jgi:ATP-dependent protease ClpP protease subunit
VRRWGEYSEHTMIYSGEINDRFLMALLGNDNDKLLFCSRGGYLYIASAAIDYVQGTDLKTAATGMCMSAAVPILAAGRKGYRTATRQTVFLVHPSSVSMGETGLEEAAKDIQADQIMSRLYDKWLENFTKKSAAWWRRSQGKVLYFNAVDAAKFGVIDFVS